MMNSIKVFLVSHDGMFRDALRSALEQHAPIDVVGDGGNVAAESVARSEASVVVVDVTSDTSTGIPVDPRGLLDSTEHVSIVVIGRSEDEAEVIRLLAEGAQGFVSRESRVAVLADAIRAVARGETVMSPGLSSRVLSHMRRMSRRLVVGQRAESDTLTPREVELLEMVARGMTNQQVASNSGLSESTVKNHLHSAFGKLGASSRSQAVTEALRRGIVKL